MAELEAVFKDTARGVRRDWRHPLPLNEPKRLGRDSSQSDWWMDDDQISRLHATVCWNGATLTVVAASDPRPRNPIQFRGQNNPEFTVGPGESFRIGRTVFTLRGDGTDDAEADAAIGTATVGAATREELREFDSVLPAVAFRALENASEILRNAGDEVALFRGMLDITLEALPRSEFAAVVYVPDVSTDADPLVKRRLGVHRLHGEGTDRFQESRRLSHDAVGRKHQRSVAHVWFAGHEHSDAAGFTLSPTDAPGTPWAFCVPFLDGSRLGLYVAGTVPQLPEVKFGKLHDRELKEMQKVADLLVSLMETRRKAFELDYLVKELKRFVPRPFWKATRGDELKNRLARSEATITVLFCDLRGSCVAAEESSGNLQTGFGALADAIDEMCRSIDKNGIIAGYQGDAVMAFWGWPEPLKDQAPLAARAALRLRERFDKDGKFKHWSCGIGIATGRAVAGGLGSHDLAKVDVYGPCVNLASRLESMTKAFGTKILIDKDTAAALAEADETGGEFRTRKLARVRPLGMSLVLTPIELLPPAEHAIGSTMPEETRRNWEQAVDEYRDGKWREAQKRLKLYFRGDPFALLLLAEMADRPGPPEGWSGVLTLTSK